MTETRRHVLVVEDDFDLRETFVSVLSRNGFAVTGVGNGAEALEALRNGPPPGVILLDLMMPVMDGWQFREKQLEVPAWAAIPVVVLSAAGPTSGAAQLGATAYLGKPIALDRLLEVVGRFCG